VSALSTLACRDGIKTDHHVVLTVPELRAAAKLDMILTERHVETDILRAMSGDFEEVDLWFMGRRVVVVGTLGL